MNIAKIITFINLIFFTCSSSSAQQTSTFSDSYFMFTSNSSPEVIDITPSALPYSQNNGQKIDFGLITYQQWCYIVIKFTNTGHKRYMLSVDNTSIDTVMLFRLKDNGEKQIEYIGGNDVPYNQHRKYVWHTITLNQESDVAYYLAVFKDQGRNINAGYKIMDTDDLDKHYTQFDRLILFYLGIVFIILIAVVYGWIIFKNIALGYYMLYILSITAWILGHYGYLYPLLYPGMPSLNSIAKPLSISCSLLFFCSLLNSLFKEMLKRDFVSRLILRSIIWSGLVILFSLIIYPILPKGIYIPAIFNVGWNSYFTFSFLSILITLLRLFKQSIIVRLIALAMGVMTIMAIQQVLSNSGFFYYELFNEHGMLLASIVEMLLLTCATFLSILEDKKRITKQMTHLKEENSRTLHQLVMVQDNERKRIAGELHDSIGPMLAAIKINFQRLFKLNSQNDTQNILVAKTEDIIDGSMAEIRNISHKLMPKELSAKGLAVSLSEYVNNLKEVYHVPIHFRHNITVVLQKDVQLNVYRIMSELILNAVKHSGASDISVSVKTAEGEINILAEDNGKGFDTVHIRDDSFGLKNIESRIEYLKGTMRIVSAKNKGTRITIVIPQKIN